MAWHCFREFMVCAVKTVSFCFDLKEVFTLGLISLNLFDYRGYLMNGKKNLYFWPASSKSVDLPFVSLFGPDVLGLFLHN
jgi:hypothetical protein